MAYLWNIKGEVDHKEKFQFEIVDLMTRDTTNLGIVRIIVIDVVIEFGRQHNTAGVKRKNKD